MSQIRPTEYLIQSGNYFRDVVDNLVEIIEREQREDVNSELDHIKRVQKVYNYDLLIVPNPPVIAVWWRGFQHDVRTIGHRNPVSMTVKMFVTVDYYHSELDTSIRKDEIRDALWELGRILWRNSDVNGLTSMGATISEGRILSRQRSNAAYAGGYINLEVPVSIRDRRGIS